MYQRRLLILIASLAFAFAGCSDDTEDSSPSNNGGSGSDTSVADTTDDTDNTTADAADEPDADASEGSDADASERDTGTVQSCSEISAQTCFSNVDCADNERCDNVGTDAAPVACCVEGERGTKSAGESCTEADDGPECLSGICITGDTTSLCSTTCTTDADCPEGMKDCKYIAGSGSDHDWCFPTE